MTERWWFNSYRKAIPLRTTSQFVGVCCVLVACGVLATRAAEPELDGPTLAWMKAAVFVFVMLESGDESPHSIASLVLGAMRLAC